MTLRGRDGRSFVRSDGRTDGRTEIPPSAQKGVEQEKPVRDQEWPTIPPPGFVVQSLKGSRRGTLGGGIAAALKGSPIEHETKFPSVHIPISPGHKRP